MAYVVCLIFYLLPAFLITGIHIFQRFADFSPLCFGKVAGERFQIGVPQEQLEILKSILEKDNHIMLLAFLGL